MVVVAVLGYAAWLHPYGLDLVDEGTLLAQFDRVRRGEVPYRDFHTGYGPATFFVNAGLLRVLGVDVAAVRSGLLVVHAVAAGLFYWLAASVVGARLAVVAVVAVWTVFRPVAPGAFATFNVPYPGWYAEAIGYGALVLAVSRVGRSASGMAVVGALWGLAFAFKQNVAVLGLAGTLVYVALRADAADGERSRGLGWMLATAMLAGLLVVAAQGPMTAWECAVYGLPIAVLAVAVIRAAPGPDLVRAGVALGLGFAGVTIAVVAWVVRAAGATEVLAGLLHVASGAAEVFRRPYPGFFESVEPLARLGSGGAAAVRESSEGLWMLALPAAALAGATAACFRSGKHPPAFVLVASVSPFLFLQLFPRADFRHLLPVAGPLLLVGLGLLGGWTPGRRRRVVGGIVLAVAIGRMLPTIPVVLELGRPAAPGAPRVERASLRWDLMGPAHLRALPDAVGAAAGAETLVGFPALAFFNFATGAPSPLRHDYFFPGVPDAEESADVLARLRAQPPALTVVLDAPIAFFPDAFAAHAAVAEAMGSSTVGLMGAS